MKMPKRGKEITIIVVVLTSIAVVAGLLLGFMNKITYVDETQALMEKIGEIYQEDIASQIDLKDYKNLPDTEILNAFIAEDNAYIVESKSKKAYDSDGLKLIVIIKDGKIIKLNGQGNSETPGLGSKALEESYLNKYIGLTYSDMSSGETTPEEEEIEFIWGFDDIHAESGATYTPEESFEVDMISGATKSSEGVMYAARAALAFYDYMEGDND